MNVRVVDASVVLAALVADDEHGEWALEQLAKASIVAPHLLYVEVANKLRKFVIQGKLSSDAASLAHAEAVRLPLQLFSYSAVAERVWSLRENVSAYDAWYVALAELLDAPLLTLDARLVRSSGPQCEFLFPRSAQ